MLIYKSKYADEPEIFRKKLQKVIERIIVSEYPSIVRFEVSFNEAERGIFCYFCVRYYVDDEAFFISNSLNIKIRSQTYSIFHSLGPELTDSIDILFFLHI